MSWNNKLFCLLCAVLIGNEVLSCPNGWITHNSVCYLFSHDTQNWIDSLLLCREWEGQLVEIGDADKNSFLKTQAKLYNRKFWIGLSDIEEENSWVWMNSKRALTKGDFKNWHTGQPNNADFDENCAAIDYKHNFEWVDAACVSKYNYICELSEYSIGQIVG